MPAFVQCIQWHICLYRAEPCCCLFRFNRQVANIFFSGRNWCKPFFGKPLYFINRYITCHHQNSIARVIVFIKKCFYIIQCCIFNMAQFGTNRHPAVWMNGISKLPHFMPYIAIRFVNIMLFKFFANHFTLHFQAFFTKGQR